MKSAAQRFRSGRAGGNVMRALAVLGIVALLAAPTAYFHHAWTSAERQMLETARSDAEFLRSRLQQEAGERHDTGGAGSAVGTEGASHPADMADARHDTGSEGQAGSAAPAWAASTSARNINAVLQQLPPMEFEGRRMVRDASGVILAQRGGVPNGPVFSVMTPLRGVPGLRADIEIIRSSKPLLWHMLGVGSLMLVLGTCLALMAVQGYRHTRGQGRDTARVSGLAEQGVVDRTTFIEGVRGALARSARDGTECTLFHLDLDHFKMINGAVGQTCADMLLEQVAKVIRVRIDTLVREAELPPALLGAPGGDVFLVLVEALPRSAPVTEAFARGVLDALGNAFEVGPYQLYLSASVGASHRAGRTMTAEKLIREAELAKIFAKNQGSGSYAIHDQNMDAQAEARDELGQALRRALANDEFLLYYQPKVHTVTGVVTGVEALLRWQPEGKPMVMPDQFIPVLEETGLIVPAGTWVLREACRQVMAWRAHGLPPVSVAVNVSARQLQQRCFVDTVAAILKETGLEPRYLELELTETIFVDNAGDNVRMLKRLADMGVSLAIDDFGTGHSSLSYLSNFSPRTLKIDRSFLSEAEDGSDNVAIARAIIALGHGMGMYVVAEGVETEAQVDFLRGYGCDQMQGFLLSRPLPADALEQWLRARIQSQLGLDTARRAALV